jgi:hypothetical protein
MLRSEILKILNSTSMRKAGFDVKYSPTTSITCPGQVGDALQKLRSMRPLFLDCFTAIQLSYILSYYDMLGDAATEKLLKFHGMKHLSISYESMIMACWRSVSEEGVSHIGKVVYIQGPRYAFAFKPSSILNGSNAIRVADGKGEQCFREFSSFCNVDRKLEEVCDIMAEGYTKPLTYRDVVEIYLHYDRWPDAMCGMSPMSRWEIWEASQSCLR